MSATIQVLVVAGGGGGGHTTGAGGGAGGLIYDANHGVIAQGYAITVGGGGQSVSILQPAGSDGQNSVFNSLTAIGGGGGGTNNASGRSGGSGGGAGHVSGFVGGAGTSGQGFAGGGGAGGANDFPNYGAGGGGGASGIGSTGTNTSGGNGGAGLSYSISGTATHYAGGGGGGTHQGGTLGLGGLGGGGNAPANNGTANTGGGGGGQKDNTEVVGGSGGSGVVIIAYATNGSNGVSTNSTGGTITTVGANTIHTFTASGTFTLVGTSAPSATTSLWTPAQLTTALWLDASDASTLYDSTTGGSLVAANGTIARWEDKSGNTRNATQATSGDRPTRRINIQNGLDILRLATAGTDSLILPNFLTSFTAGSGFFIVKSVVYPPTNSNYTGPVLGDFGTDGASNHNTWLDGSFYEDFGRGSRHSFAPPSTLANWFMCSFISALNDWRAYFNAAILNTQTSNTVSWSTVPKIGRSLGQGAVNHYFPGDIAEIVVLSKAASTEERQLIDGYLAHKWGLSANLPAGHPYKSAAPTNSSRRNNTMIGNF